MTKVQPGDVVISFASAKVQAIGVASGLAQEWPRPVEFGDAGNAWSDIGWYVPVAFERIENPLRPQEVASELAPLLPEMYSPIRADGKGNQGIYLAAIPDGMAAKLRELLRGQVEAVEQKTAWHPDPEPDNEVAEKQLNQRTDIGPTQKAQLVRARRGQGVFRSNVAQIEDGCRVTGVTNGAHLRASHIKPWKDSNDFEKLDGNNGLLLAPHVDHLFDRGYISFDDDGGILVSRTLNVDILSRWAIDPRKKCGTFSELQRKYLDHHRKHVFA